MESGTSLAKPKPGQAPSLGRLCNKDWERSFNRMIVNNIKRTIDPDYSRSFQRARDRAQKLHGQQFWYGPGDAPHLVARCVGVTSNGSELHQAASGMRSRSLSSVIG
jgi:hypothetical protein